MVITYNRNNILDIFHVLKCYYNIKESNYGQESKYLREII